MIHPLKRLIPYLKPYRHLLLPGALALVCANSFALAIPRQIGSIVDGLRGEAALDSDWLLRQAGILLLLTFLAGISRFFMRWLMIGASRRIEYDIRDDFFRHLLTLDQAWFQKNPVGDLMARSSNDLNAVRMMLGPGLMYPLNILVILSIALSLMLSLNWKLSLLSLLPLPFLSLIVYRSSQVLHRGYEKIQKRFALLSSRSQATFSGIRVVKTFLREDHESESFERESRAYYRENLRVARFMSIFHPSMRMFSGLAVILVLYFGGQAVMNEEVTLGTLIAFMQYLILLSWPIAALGWVTSIIQRGSASWKRLLEILDARPDILDGGILPDRDYQADLEFRDLSLRIGETQILRDLNLIIPAGEFLAITGRTGSGKSVLMSLLPRILDPPPETVFLGGQDILDFPLSELRKQLAWVGQEPLLFSESLRSNLEFAGSDLALEEIEAAASDSQILEEIHAFPRAWDTVIGERGTRLSGGQRQRLCLARALLRKAPLILLDDPFSSVDTRTEEEILGSLKKHFPGNTVILSSHRASTLRLADRICVLEEGRIAEVGSHDELLKKRGLYFDIHERQNLQERLEGRREGE
ncbi:MAG: ABC transporter ATP-binding protein [Candidatus Krumholzibacteria bacterium]|nr:ABC transporter ATP-binding protein [Candidatus Krumholzibacteria bacterium]MDP6670131.1 ABC transporter ATP-binding protein [Candidatus Krumholzibacteria bacterium]MDP6797283.1 ABC transporter ATP-binding protein [Candidatus Krumholzibacteria bacterium]MDP7020783.1 ABC transporter ATP-binding protein [Candidatus Krumholzibacteria bacterium]